MLRSNVFRNFVIFFIMTILSVIISHALFVVVMHDMYESDEPVEIVKDAIVMDDSRELYRTISYDGSLMLALKYDYSIDLESDAILIHEQAIEKPESKTMWKFYKNPDGTVDLVIDFISDYKTKITLKSEPAYMLFKNIHFNAIALPNSKYYLSSDDEWYSVDEVNDSVVYEHVDKIVTVKMLMDKYAS